MLVGHRSLSADGCSCVPGKSAGFAPFQKLVLVDATEKLNQFSDQARPSSLVARSQARAIVPVKIFVEQNVVSPVRIGLKLLGVSIHRPSPRFISQENSRQ